MKTKEYSTLNEVASFLASSGFISSTNFGDYSPSSNPFFEPNGKYFTILWKSDEQEFRLMFDSEDAMYLKCIDKISNESSEGTCRTITDVWKSILSDVKDLVKEGN